MVHVPSSMVESFNPHRSRRTGATRPAFHMIAAHMVSILTGPEGPVQRALQRAGVQLEEVSILTSPEGPVQLGRVVQGVGLCSFQSSPVPKDRCN